MVEMKKKKQPGIGRHGKRICSVVEIKSSQISGGTENVYTAWRAGLGAVQKTEPESDFK
jgi:hypothetical protein